MGGPSCPWVLTPMGQARVKAAVRRLIGGSLPRMIFSTLLFLGIISVNPRSLFLFTFPPSRKPGSPLLREILRTQLTVINAATRLTV